MVVISGKTGDNHNALEIPLNSLKSSTTDKFANIISLYPYDLKMSVFSDGNYGERSLLINGDGDKFDFTVNLIENPDFIKSIEISSITFDEYINMINEFNSANNVPDDTLPGDDPDDYYNGEAEPEGGLSEPSNDTNTPPQDEIIEEDIEETTESVTEETTESNTLGELDDSAVKKYETNNDKKTLFGNLSKSNLQSKAITGELYNYIIIYNRKAHV